MLCVSICTVQSGPPLYRLVCTSPYANVFNDLFGCGETINPYHAEVSFENREDPDQLASQNPFYSIRPACTYILHVAFTGILQVNLITIGKESSTQNNIPHGKVKC